MLNAMLEAMVLSEMTKAISSSFSSSSSSSAERENRRLREQVERQDAKIERLENALVQVGVAVSQVGAVVAAGAQQPYQQANRPQHVAALPAPAASQGKSTAFWKGQVLTGTVNKIHNSGVNVSIGDYFGFLPMRQIVPLPANHPSDALRKGQKVRVKVTGIDRKKDLVFLSMKQCH